MYLTRNWTGRICDMSHFLLGLPGRRDPGFDLGDLFYMESEIYIIREETAF